MWERAAGAWNECMKGEDVRPCFLVAAHTKFPSSVS